MVWVLVLDMTACLEASATKSKIERGLFVRLCFQSVSQTGERTRGFHHLFKKFCSTLRNIVLNLQENDVTDPELK